MWMCLSQECHQDCSHAPWCQPPPSHPPSLSCDVQTAAALPSDVQNFSKAREWNPGLCVRRHVNLVLLWFLIRAAETQGCCERLLHIKSFLCMKVKTQNHICNCSARSFSWTSRHRRAEVYLCESASAEPAHQRSGQDSWCWIWTLENWCPAPHRASQRSAGLHTKALAGISKLQEADHF